MRSHHQSSLQKQICVYEIDSNQSLLCMASKDGGLLVGSWAINTDVSQTAFTLIAVAIILLLSGFANTAYAADETQSYT